jgi:two-component sensor histidine kinase
MSGHNEAGAQAYGPAAAAEDVAINGRRSRLAALAAIIVVVWLLQFTAGTVRSFLDPMPFMEQLSWAARRFGVHLAGMAITAGLFVAMSRADRWRLTPRFGLALLLSMAGAVVVGGVNELVFYHWFKVNWSEASSPLWMRMLLFLTMQSWTFLACLGAYIGLSYAEEAREREVRLMRAEALAVDAQNRMLRQQINPHFLFNTLNALSTLVLQGRNKAAEQTILSLARFMRRSLQLETTSLVTLADEADAEAEYLSIEKVRFGDRLEVVWDISEEAGEAWVPSLILQPVVENAVKYGVSGTAHTVTITVRARVEDGMLLLAVRDDGWGSLAGGAKGGLGVGLENVRQRLQALYGARGRVAWRAEAPRGFVVDLALPFSRRAAAAAA